MQIRVISELSPDGWGCYTHVGLEIDGIRAIFVEKRSDGYASWKDISTLDEWRRKLSRIVEAASNIE